MRNLVFLLSVLILITSSCNFSKKKKDYSNQTTYQVAVEETFEIFYSTNSCCMHCRIEEEKLNHVAFIESKIVVPWKKDCAGCNYVAALQYKAISLGIDTIRGAVVPSSRSCLDSLTQIEEYIVIVK